MAGMVNFFHLNIPAN